jgi:hypothetical protein
MLAETATDLPQQLGPTLVTTLALVPTFAALAVAALSHVVPLLPSLAGRA